MISTWEFCSEKFVKAHKKRKNPTGKNSAKKPTQKKNKLTAAVPGKNM
jgi:hypothetical protein